MKTIVLVGHRGTGKSSFLKRWSLFGAKEIEFIDLDAEIEKQEQKPVSEIFTVKGEVYFRDCEKKVFTKIFKEVNQVISLGAGFDLKNLPATCEVFWIRRDSDSLGRIFLDRPRLEEKVSPLQEYANKFSPREKAFKKACHFVWTLPEGPLDFSKQALHFERSLLDFNNYPVGGFRMLTKVDLHRRSLAKPELFELRNDLLSTEEIYKFCERYENILFSLRSKEKIPKTLKTKNYWFDVDRSLLEVFPDLNKKKLIVSSHQNDLAVGIKDLELPENSYAHLKLCPLVESWKDLARGFAWQQQDPLRRSFLPRSTRGQWAWFRLFMKGRQWINFWREDDNSHPDQPSLFWWSQCPYKAQKFSAVLGSPVNHSYSPLFHLDFCKDQASILFAIDVAEQELLEAWPFLNSLGLSQIAVTAPLKTKIFELDVRPDEVSKDLQSINTLKKDSLEQWQAINTDIAGFKVSTEGLPEPIVIWGGGGTLKMMKKVWPQAQAYSARKACPRDGEAEIGDPKTLIWAAPATREVQMPLKTWKPSFIYDLNYGENSWGRAYAQSCGGKYQSGLAYFKLQALEQQKFWSEKK